MRLVHKDGIMINDNMYDGRNSEWFDNLCGCGYDESYDNLQRYMNVDLPECASEEDKAECKEYGYGARYITVENYMKWYYLCKPHKDAGWFTTYEMWKMDNKNWAPDFDTIKHSLNKDDNPADFIFTEVVNPYDCNTYIIKNLPTAVETNPADYIIYFYFDR